jgi:hypothetical protein
MKQPNLINHKKDLYLITSKWTYPCKVIENATFFDTENETLKVCSFCNLLIYFRNVLRGNAIFPYPEISFEIGKHPADFRPGNSKGDNKECM